jgi:hypothetical protein
MVKPPCAIDCPNRKMGCHGVCREYLEYAEKRQQERDARHQKMEELYDLSAEAKAAVRKYRRMRRK